MNMERYSNYQYNARSWNQITLFREKKASTANTVCLISQISGECASLTMATSNKSNRAGHRNKRRSKEKQSANAESTRTNKKSKTKNGRNRSEREREAEDDSVDHEERSVDLLLEPEPEQMNGDEKEEQTDEDEEEDQLSAVGGRDHDLIDEDSVISENEKDDSGGDYHKQTSSTARRSKNWSGKKKKQQESTSSGRRDTDRVRAVTTITEHRNHAFISCPLSNNHGKRQNDARVLVSHAGQNIQHGQRGLPPSVRARLAIARQEEMRLTENQNENRASDKDRDSGSDSAVESQITSTSGDARKGQVKKGDAAQMEMFNIQKYVRQTIFSKKKLYLKSPKWKWEGNFSRPS